METLLYKIFIHDLYNDTYEVYDDKIYDSLFEANRKMYYYLSEIDTNRYNICIRRVGYDC